MSKKGKESDLTQRRRKEMNMTAHRKPRPAAQVLLVFVLAIVIPAGVVLAGVVLAPLGIAFADDQQGSDRNHRSKSPETLYIWAGDQARVAPDFLAVIDFDEGSPDYGRVIKTVPVPPP